MGRTTYTEEFIGRFKQLYARFGRDMDCVTQLREEYGHQYPAINTPTLQKIRAKRSKEFDNARRARVKEVLKFQGDRDRDLLLTAKDLNSSVVERLMDRQQKLLDNLDTLDPEDEAFDAECTLLLSTMTAIQEKINTFSGLDLANQLALYRTRLIEKKIIDEKSVDEVIKYLGAGLTVSQSMQVDSSEEKPRLTFHNDDTGKKSEGAE